MKICVLDFERKADLLKNKLLSGKSFEEYERKIAPSLCTEGMFTVFISVCDTITRAKVLRCTSSTLSEAWYGACKSTAKFLSSKEYNPVWVKADIMCRSERISTEKLIETISKGFHEFYRRGISFDNELKTAMTEAEINGNRVLSYKEKTITPVQVNKYLYSACGVKLDRLPEEVDG